MPLKYAVKERQLTHAHVKALQEVWKNGSVKVAFYLGEPSISEHTPRDAAATHKLLAELARKGYLHCKSGNSAVFTIPEGKAVKMGAVLKKYFAKTRVSRRKFYAAGTRHLRAKRA
ncbi:MAG: hypothetical protein AABW54_04355 [Candidatus Micrarchaeota archaeon]